METYSLSGLSFYYPEQETAALRDVSFHVRPGEFLTLCGPSGCGKTTLLRQLKPAMTPHGVRQGEICFLGRPLEEIDPREQAAQIGFVQQSPENQIVTDKVWHELAFGLESLGCDTATIRGRVAEMASFFGIQTWFHKDVSELSGGQKQLLNLAAVMAMQPAVLILDEPTSQLDPIAASEFLATVGKINRELGTTVIMTEHRLEEVFPMSDRVLVMDGGRILAHGTPGEVGARLKDAGHAMFLAMPTPMRVWAAVQSDAPCPVTVRDGRDFLTEYAGTHPLQPVPKPDPPAQSGQTAVELSELWFRYEKTQADVIKGLSLTLHKGEFLALLGGNGTGKTTTLSVIAGLRKAYRGEVKCNGTVGMLPQNPQTLFVKKTVREDLFELLRDGGLTREEQGKKIARIARLCRLEELLDRHPYDLSGGEQQRAALAKILLKEPDILLLDEPTKGLDAEFKQVFAVVMQKLLQRGVSVLMVSHDVEFCAQYAHRCALFFDGNLVTQGTPEAFFSGNSFYTTAANRMARTVLPEAVTATQVIAACGGQLPPLPELSPDTPPLPPPAENSPAAKAPKLPLWRKILAALCAGTVIFAFFKIMGVTDLTQLIADSPLRAQGNLLWLYVLVGGLLAFAFAVARKAPPERCPAQTPAARRGVSKRTAVAAGMILLLIPLTIFVGIYYLGGRKYYFISLAILLETMLPFFLIFEGRKPQARELVVIAVLCALGVAGRAAFFMLPNFKPVMALVIIAGVAFGPESGFLVGAMTMLASNVLFGQGPWTPWQMFAMGISGFLAGLLFRKGLLRRNRISLGIFGALCAVILYGGILNTSSALIWAHNISWQIVLSYLAAGLPMDLVHAAATFLVLFFAAEPMLEKLDRIKVKYGLVE